MISDRTIFPVASGVHPDLPALQPSIKYILQWCMHQHFDFTLDFHWTKFKISQKHFTFICLLICTNSNIPMVHKMLIYIMYHNHPNIFFLWIKKLRLTAWGRGHAIFLLTPSCSAVTLWSCLLLVNSNLSSRSYVSLTTENTLLWTVPIT